MSDSAGLDAQAGGQDTGLVEGGDTVATATVLEGDSAGGGPRTAVVGTTTGFLTHPPTPSIEESCFPSSIGRTKDP
jgi:hypothetical protein